MNKRKTILDFFSKSPATTQDAEHVKSEASNGSTPKSHASKSSQVLSNDYIPTKKNTSPVVKSPTCKTSVKSEKVVTKSPFTETFVKADSRKFASKCDIPLNASIEKTPSESKTLKNSDTSSSSKSDSPITKTPIRKVSAKLKTSVDTASSPSISNERCDKIFSQREKRLRSLDKSYKYESEESEEEKEERPSKNKKRRRIVIESDDDSDEYMPEKDHESESSSASNEDSFKSPAREVRNGNRSECHAESSDDMSETSNPKKKRKRTQSKSTPSFEIFTNPKASPKKKLNISASMTTPKSGARSSFSKICTPLKLQLPGNEELDDSNESKKDVKEFLHEKWTWLKNDAIVDESKNYVENDASERSTIRVPPDFYKTLTPAMQQWWRLKEKNFDTVLFFKVGKFYELYHMDAVIGVKELGLVYMKGDYAHAGFPEIAFGRYSECLIGKGYKVARVEQTETPQMMEERCKNSNCAKSKRVVEREICQITSKGTRTYTYQDENITSSNNFLLVICEKEVENSKSTSEYGICFIDTSIGKFTLGQFIDDRHGSRLLTLIALYPPVEVIYEKSSVTKETVQLLNHHLSGAQITRSGSDFWLPYKIMQHLQQTGIFVLEDESIEYPETFMKFLDPGDINKETPLKHYELAIKAFAGCISYLNRCGIDDSILSMKLFDEYIPVDELKSEICKSSKDFKKHMILDGLTLENLDIVPLMSSDNAEGTLLGTMDYCSTSFGKRLFRNWLCSPLCNPDQILDRVNAVDDLVQIPDVVELAVAILKKLPDLERHLSKIHTYGFNRSKLHPETRAIFYEIDTYNKKKINDFLSALEGFKQTSEIVSLFKPHVENFKSPLLKQCTSYKDKLGHFPDMSQALNYFDDAFNHEEAKKKGYIIPSEGIDADYDKASREVAETLKELDAFLAKQKQLLNCKVSYVSVGKNRYMLEVPENKKVPSEFQFQGGRKGFKRYYTKETTTLLSRLVCAEDSRSVALHNSTRRIYSLFDKDYELWKTAVHCISSLDALISLVLYYKSSGVPMCKPEFSIPNQEVEPHLEIINGHHPTFLKYFTGDSYIPNSVYIGPKRVNSTENMNTGGKLVLVTGPNMGGKSTLMRQAGALVIMAHVGSYVPAEAMRLTPVDRIFTRVGASDRINKGESTFFVEASETSSILSHASPDSFVLIDELGRGTATFDGTAIAYSTLKYLVDKIRCRTLFSTHYHSLCDDYSVHPNVGLGHMACMVEKDSNCSVLEKITFLYKFVDGSCPKSYGFNVAMLAGIAKDIVEEGFMKAQQMEISMRISILLRRLLCAKSPAEILRELQNYNLFEDKNK